MKNMKVRSKLIVSFLVVAALTATVGIAGVLGLNMLNSNEEAMYRQSVTANNAAMSLRNIQAQRASCRGAALKQMLGLEYEAEFTALSTLNTEIDGFFTALESALTLKVNKDRLAVTKQAYAEYLALRDPFMDAVRQDNKEVLTEVLKKIGVPLDTIVENLSAISQSALEVVSNRNIEDGNTANTLILWLSLAVTAAVAVAIFFALYISGLISKPLSLIAGALEQMGTKGDLELDAQTARRADEYATWKDECGMCARAVNGLLRHLQDIEQTLVCVADGDLTVTVSTLSDRDNMGVSVARMLDNLNGMFGDINVSTVQVTSASKQIADGAQTLAQGSTEQASAVEELSGSIAAIAQKTRDNAEMAEKASGLANTIKQNAEKGNRQMGEMMSAVKDINEASQSISNVIKVIDEIAFQTNILALNASVEAARAGQHGKGFAVVAEEVGSLAAKSAEAAKNTENLIANSMQKAEEGARIAGETATSLVEIVTGINESSQLVGQIAKSSEEQSAGINEINSGIEQVAQVVQSNSATAQQSAAASQEMSSQASLLGELIAQFKLKETGSERGRPRLTSAKTAARKRVPAAGNHDFGRDEEGGFGKY